MLNFVENLLENERDPRSGPMSDQDHSLSLSDPDRSLALSHFLTNFLQNLASYSLYTSPNIILHAIFLTFNVSRQFRRLQSSAKRRTPKTGKRTGRRKPRVSTI
jgi:hypothetical protein